MHNQQRPVVAAYGTLLNVMWQPGWESGFQEEWITCICMAESFHYSPETTAALLIGYIPIQNSFDAKKLKYIYIYIYIYIHIIRMRNSPYRLS